MQEARSYHEWIARAEDDAASPLVDPALGPLISVVVPAFNTPDRYLTPMVESVIRQSYPRWELCLVDASSDPDRSQAIVRASSRDDRIRLIRLDDNHGIAGNTNAGIEAARGDYVAFLDHDDTLAPFALNEVAAALLQAPDTDLFYSDEDKLSDRGDRRSRPFFKPGWSPDLFLAVNYLAHFVVARTTLVRSVGGIRTGYEGAQDYDFILRVLQKAPKIHHVPRVSYHWRMAEGSNARDPSRKAYAEEAGCRALREHLARMGIAATVEPATLQSTTYRLRYDVPHRPEVHVLGAAEDLLSLPDGDVVLITEVAETPEDPGWLEELGAVASQPGVGVVAPALRTPDGTSGGIGYFATGRRLRPLFVGERLDRWTPAGWPAWPRNLVAVGGCGVLTVGLTRELLAEGAELGIVSLSLAAHRRGLRNVHWPFAGFVTSSKLQPLELEQPVEDPYLNPNLPPPATLPDPLVTEPGTR
jgi:O-antigen biosynthesis protein